MFISLGYDNLLKSNRTIASVDERENGFGNALYVLHAAKRAWETATSRV